MKFNDNDTERHRDGVTHVLDQGFTPVADSLDQAPAVVPWLKEVEIQGPGVLPDPKLRPPKTHVFGSEYSDVSNLVVDLGDAQQLAQTRSLAQEAVYPVTEYLGPCSVSQSGPGSEIPSITEISYLLDEDRDPEDSGGQDLGRRIRAVLKESSWGGDTKRFLPINQLDLIITKTTIRQELERKQISTSFVDKIWDKPFPTSSLTTRRKIFAILVLIQKVASIVDFVENDVYDNDLPFNFRPVSTGKRKGTYDVYRNTKPGKEPILLRFFQDHWVTNKGSRQTHQKWSDNNMESFNRDQWQLLAPFLDLKTKKVEHMELPNKALLPFIVVDRPVVHVGGSCEVYRVRIHSAHQNIFPSTGGNDHPSYAVKRLTSSDHALFKKEVDIFKRFVGDNQHPHLIKLLKTFLYRDHYHLLFHWADCNLLDYWRVEFPEAQKIPRDASFVRWISEQWLCIVRALQKIHEYKPDLERPFVDTDPSDPRLYGQHGDLKPQNILWFRGHDFTEELEKKFGRLVISDFGITKFHREVTKSEVNPVQLGRSHSHRPPEYDMKDRVSQISDIWSLGCVLLEFLHWHIRGWEGVEKFREARVKDSNDIPMDDYFNCKYARPGKKATLKRSVHVAFEDLRKEATQFNLEVLEMVQKKLLRMEPENRASCKEILEMLEEMNKRCSTDPEYCTRPVRPRQIGKPPNRASTELSELSGASPIADNCGGGIGIGSFVTEPYSESEGLRLLNDDGPLSIQKPRPSVEDNEDGSTEKEQEGRQTSRPNSKTVQFSDSAALGSRRSGSERTPSSPTRHDVERPQSPLSQGVGNISGPGKSAMHNRSPKRNESRVLMTEQGFPEDTPEPFLPSIEGDAFLEGQPNAQSVAKTGLQSHSETAMSSTRIEGHEPEDSGNGSTKHEPDTQQGNDREAASNTLNKADCEMKLPVPGNMSTAKHKKGWRQRWKEASCFSG